MHVQNCIVNPRVVGLELLSTPMGAYVVIGFDMEVQALVTHNAA